MKLRFFALLVVLLLTTLPAPSPAAAEEDDRPPADYRRLPDLPLFVDTARGQWAGSGNGMILTTDEFAQLPLEAGAGSGGRPAYRLSVTGENGWWLALLAGENWAAYSIAPYAAEGALVFDIRGAAGGEDLKLSLNDVAYGRFPENLSSAEVVLSEFVTVTQEWQTVRIPLTAFLTTAPGFDQEQLFTVNLGGVNGAPLTVWLSNMRFSSPGVEQGLAAVKLNELGYLSAAAKIARVSGFDEDLAARAGTPFAVRDLSSNQVALAGTLTEIAAYDAGASGERVLAADFSTLTTPGAYYLTVDAYGVAASAPFIIGPAVYDRLLVDAQRYFYLQRSGLALEEAFAGPFARAAGHPQDANAALRSGLAQNLDVSGGWYDAGDYGKYTNAGATAVSDLLWAYEMFPDQFGDGQLNIPESSNGVPDLLDEARWELDWIRRMQDPGSGGFYHAVQPTEQTTAPNARGLRYIEDVAGDRTNVRPTSSTASAVGALAHGALVFADVDASYAATLLAAAEQGWAYLLAQPEGVAPVDGPYRDDDDSQERLWAAAALYRATGDAQYDTYFRASYAGVDSFFASADDNAYGVPNMEMIAWLHYSHSADPNGQVLAYFEPLFEEWSARMTARRSASAWSLTLLGEDFYWGSNYVTLTTPLVMFVGARGLGLPETDAQAAALDALDYLLGANPLRFSYVSGYGETHVQRPVSAQWSADGVAAVPAGILAGGPNQYDNPLLFSNFPARRYVDGAGSWTVNEHTIYWNAALVFNAALAADAGRTMPVPATVEGTVATAPQSDPPPSASAAPAATVAADAPQAAPAAAPSAAGADPLLRGLLAAVVVWLALLSLFMAALWRRLPRK